MARVVVTGGFGFLGSHLVEALVRRGDAVTIFDSGAALPDLPAAAIGVRHVAGDVRDLARLAEVITGDVDVVYHMAAVVGVDRYLDRPLDVIDINLLGTRNVLDLATKAEAKVLLASTSEVFGMNPAVPWREDDDRVLGSTTIDRWSYASSKALAEHLAFAFARAHGLAVTILRYFNVYGPRQRPAFVVSRTIHRMLSGERPVVYDGGSQTRCFTFIDDAIEATIAAGMSEKADGECFHVGSSVETSVIQLAHLIAELIGAGPEVVTSDTKERLGTRYQDLARRVPDTTKIREVLGWRSTTELRNGLRMTVEWARSNPWWLALPASGAE
jgi:dTDP-alpha-D-glucuronic acid decarboxylase